jgi:hypothetical protein
MGLSKKERKRLISSIKRASGVAEYALEAKMSDEQVEEAAKQLETFKLIKAANDYNRYCQGQKTAEANAKLKQFIDPQNSEIFKAGQWLINNLSKTGQGRKNGLIEKDLVHKEDYNIAVTDHQIVIKEQKEGLYNQTELATQTIKDLEKVNDSLREQLAFIRDYIINNYGQRNWNQIVKFMPSRHEYENRHENN